MSRDLSQWHKNKGAIGQPWMRQNKTIRRGLRLLLGRKAAPEIMGLAIWQHQILHRQKIQVKHPPGPARAALAAMRGLNLVQKSKHLQRVQPVRVLKCGSRIHIVRPGTGGKTRRGKKPATGRKPQA